MDNLAGERHVRFALVSARRQEHTEWQHHDLDVARLLVLKGSQLKLILFPATGREARSRFEEPFLLTLNNFCGLRTGFLQWHEGNAINN